MAMAAMAKQESSTSQGSNQHQGTAKILPMRLPKHLSSLMQQASLKVSVRQLRTSMIFLQGSLPSGALNLFSVRRSGRGFGVSTACPFCDAKPPKDLPSHRTDLRRRWQAAHLAMHVKKRDSQFNSIEGDLRRV